MRPGLRPPGSGPRLPALEAGLQGRRAFCPGRSRRSGSGQQGPSAPAPGVLALREAEAPRGVALQAHAAALLHLAVAEGPAGAVGTEQGHVPRRSPQPLAAPAPVLHGIGLQGVPAGGAAQRQGPRPPANSPRLAAELQTARPAWSSWLSRADWPVRELGGTQVGSRGPQRTAKAASETSISEAEECGSRRGTGLGPCTPALPLGPRGGGHRIPSHSSCPALACPHGAPREPSAGGRVTYVEVLSPQWPWQ